MNKRPATYLLGAVIAVAAAFGTHFEGQRLTAYQDTGGVWTLCDGHTAGVKPGDTATAAQCQAWLQQEMGDALATVQRCVGRGMPLHVVAALTDFTYNEGPGKKGVKDGFCVLKSGAQPTILRNARAGDWMAVCDQFQYWTRAGGKTLPGLVARREAERKLCAGDPL